MNIVHLTENTINELENIVTKNDKIIPEKLSKQYPIIRYKDGQINEIEDNIVEEVDTDVYSTICENFHMTSSPWDIEELAIGAAFNRGYLEIYRDRINHEKDKSSIKINIEKIIQYAKVLEESSELFIATGGVHNCYICTEDKMLIMKSDVGRHNVLDRVAGYSIINNIDLTKHILCFSGRIPLEIIKKVINMGVKIFISVAAPTSSAIDLAKENDITLIGFVRGNKFNIYSGRQRVIGI